jgi:peroxiredoxin (alkyl hydroperoxide reductase subunit C)
MQRKDFSMKEAGCARPTGGPVGEPEGKETSETAEKPVGLEHNMIKVGQKAPDFSAPAYHNGKFTSVQLSDFLGRWIVLCFYPGDFTFV